MADVFISYKREDRERVASIASALSARGLSVFWDADTPIGSTWLEMLSREISACKVLLVAWSKHTEDVREARFVISEVSRAEKYEKPIVPVLLDECQIPLGFDGMQAASLIGWSGDAENPSWRSILEHVSSLTTPSAVETRDPRPITVVSGTAHVDAREASPVAIPTSTPRGPLRYAAFLSFSSRDGEEARRFHRRLERYKYSVSARAKIPPHFGKGRLFPIFRDQQELLAGGSLTEQIDRALDASGALIVLCSPSAAQSVWVNREILAFQTAYPDAPILPVILSGVPNSGDERECYPEALKWRMNSDGTPVSAGYLGVDLQKDAHAIPRIAAGVAGLSFDEVSGRQGQVARRRLVAGMFTHLLAFGVGAAVALAFSPSIWKFLSGR